MADRAVAVVIFVPPAAPVTSWTLLFSSTKMAGHIEDKGLFPGLMKFAGDGGTPKAFVMLGAEKSSISSLRMIPVLLERTCEPKLQGCQPNTVRSLH